MPQNVNNENCKKYTYSLILTSIKKKMVRCKLLSSSFQITAVTYLNLTSSICLWKRGDSIFFKANLITYAYNSSMLALLDYILLMFSILCWTFNSSLSISCPYVMSIKNANVNFGCNYSYIIFRKGIRQSIFPFNYRIEFNYENTILREIQT